MEHKNKPKIIAIGGGKGGVGKSLISSGISTALAIRGKSTICIDLDLGGANLHTFFGIKTTQKGIGDFLYRPHSKHLADYATDIEEVNNLKLISGSGFIPGIANLYYFQKLKILRAINKLNFDYVILDLGAGTNYNVIDFFSLTKSGIVVTNPEPTAILNGYEFIKNVLFRIFSRSFKKDEIVLEVIEAHKFGQNQDQGTRVKDLIETLKQINKDAALKVKKICDNFKPYLVLNMIRSTQHSKSLAMNLIEICKNFLEIELNYLGAVPADNNVAKELIKLNNIILKRPNTKASKAIFALADNCLNDFTTADLPSESFSQDFKVKPEEKRNEGLELATMMERFFSEFKKAQGRNSDICELSPLEILEPQLMVNNEITRPIFIRDIKTNTENLTVPNKLNELLSFIVELADLEEEIKSDKNNKELDIDLSEIANAWFKTGCVLSKSGQYSTALRSFKKVLDISPDNWQALNNLASCYIVLGQLKNAQNIISKALQFSNDIRVHFNQALLEFLYGNYKNCLNIINEIKEKSNLTAKLNFLKSYCLFYLGDYEGCLTNLDQLDGEEKEFNCGLIHLITGDAVKAIYHLKNYLRYNKTNQDSLALLAIAFFEIGQRQDAISTLEKAISLSPADIKIRALTAYFSYKEGFLDKAIKEAEVISKLRPTNPNLINFVSEIKNYLA